MTPRTIVTLLVLMLGAGALRLSGLMSESLWLDEIATVDFIGTHGVGDIIRETFRTDYHPFAYYALLDIWSLILGASDHACRLFSVLLGVASVAAAYRLGMTVSRSWVTALAAALITAVAPTHVWYSQECRMYIFMVLMWTLCLDSLIRVVSQESRLRSSAAFLVTFFFFAYAHGSAGLLVLPFLLGALLWSGESSGHGRLQAPPAPGGKRQAAAWWPHLLSRRRLFLAALTLAVYIPWLVRLLALGTDGKALETLRPRDVPELLEWFVFFNRRPPLPGLFVFWLASGLSIGGLLLSSYRNGARSPRFSTVLLLVASLIVPIVTAAVLSLVVPLHQARNLVFLMVPLVVLVCAGVVHLSTAIGRSSSPWLRFAIVGLAVTFVTTGAGYLTRTTVRNIGRVPQKENWRGATRYLIEHARAGEVVAFYAGFTAPCFEFYAARERLHDRSGDRPAASERTHDLVLVRVERDALVAESAAALLEEIKDRESETVWVVYSHVTEPERLEELVLESGLGKQSTVDFRDVLVVSYTRHQRALTPAGSESTPQRGR